MKRTQKSFVNVLTSFLTNAVLLVTAFVVQRTLIATKGPDYNGINGLFSSIISMMSLADLGLGTAIIYHMYRPVAERDEEKINGLLRFYRNCYVVISGIVLVIGAVVALFLPLLVGDVKIADSIYLIYVLFLADCISSYFLGYRKSLLYADLQNYVPDLIYFFTYLIQNALQIWVLVAYQNFILFLIIKTLGKIIPNLITSVYIRVKYPFTKCKDVQPVEPEVKQDIITKVKGLFCHKVGKILVTGSDSIVITGVLGLGVMNLYTNYYLVISGVRALLVRIFEILTNSVGNFLLDSDKERNMDVYRKIDFLNFWCFGCVAAGMYAVMQPLIVLWLGEEFLFGKVVLLVLVVNFYLDGMRASVNTFKEAAGIFHEDRHIPLAEAGLNLVLSVILAKFFGAAGVFLGTILSMTVVYFYSYPKYVCKPLFGMGFGRYIAKTLEHLAVLLVTLWGTECIIVKMESWNPWLRLPAAGLVAVVVFHVIFLALYGRCEEFRFYVEMMKGKVAAVINAILRIRRAVGKYADIYYLIFILAMTGMTSMGINSGDSIYMKVFLVATLFLLLKMAVTDFTWREISIMAVFTLLFGVNLLRNGEKTLILTAMGIFGAKNVDLRKVMKCALWEKAVLTVGTLSLAALGVIENVVLNLPKNDAHYDIACYGYEHPNMAFANIFVILLLAILVYGDRMKWYGYAIGTLIMFGAYKVFMCRTGLLIWILLCLMVLGYRVLRKFQWEKAYLWLFTVIPPVLSVVTMVMPVIARKNEAFKQFIHRLLTGRVNLIDKVYDQVWGLWLGHAPQQSFDSIYFHTLYNYGWIAFILCLVAYSVGMCYANKKGKSYEVIALGIMAVYGYMELLPLSVLWNLPLLYLSWVLFREKKIIHEQL